MYLVAVGVAAVSVVEDCRRLVTSWTDGCLASMAIGGVICVELASVVSCGSLVDAWLDVRTVAYDVVCLRAGSVESECSPLPRPCLGVLVSSVSFACDMTK